MQAEGDGETLPQSVDFPVKSLQELKAQPPEPFPGSFLVVLPPQKQPGLDRPFAILFPAKWRRGLFSPPSFYLDKTACLVPEFATKGGKRAAGLEGWLSQLSQREGGIEWGQEPQWAKGICGWVSRWVPAARLSQAGQRRPLGVWGSKSPPPPACSRHSRCLPRREALLACRLAASCPPSLLQGRANPPHVHSSMGTTAPAGSLQREGPPQMTAVFSSPSSQ